MDDPRKTNRLTTGNEFISLPDIILDNAGINCIGFLHKGFRSSVEIHGTKACPIIRPYIEVDGIDLFENKTSVDLLAYWIPRFITSSDKIEVESVVFAPLERRGFARVMKITNKTEQEIPIKAGWTGCWESSCSTANISKPIVGKKHININSWRPGAPVFEMRAHIPLFAIAFLSQEIMPVKVWSDRSDQQVMSSADSGFSADSDTPIYYEMIDEYVLAPKEERFLPLYVGVGLEEVSAVASADELRLQGWENAYSALVTWLQAHEIGCDDEHFKWMINFNSFYNYFFSQGITIDTEELFITSARSSRCERCASYRERDAMRWSLPAVLQINWAQARKMLIYAFTVQLANVGIHSRFIDGIVLQPGLQLDQLCAPIRSLSTYVQLTGDMSVLFDRRVQAGVNDIQRVLVAQRHPEVALFESLLLPSGSPSKLPYITFSNVLVWRVLQDIATLYERIRDLDRADEASALAAQVKSSIIGNMVVPGPYGDMFAFSVDMQGNLEIGDDPEGSLLLLPYFTFCSADDPIFKNTEKMIVEKFKFSEKSGTASLLYVINSLLTGRRNESLDFLRTALLDDGVACDTVDTVVGRAITGMAYAACAGYLAFALRVALGASLPVTVEDHDTRAPIDTLYQPPPETFQDVRKARL